MSQHRAEASARLSPIGRRLFKFIEFDDDEELLVEIRKHPIGLVFIIITGLLIATVLLVATMLLAFGLDGFGLDIGEGGTGPLRGIIVGLGIVLSLFAILGMIISIILYRSNVVYITNEKIAEVMYVSLLNRRVMQLGIGNVEDVTVIQKGILPRIFNYANLIVETAGEIANPAFTFVPTPHENSNVIIEAHEGYVKRYGN